MKPSICIVAQRIKRLPLHHQIHHLRSLISLEKPRSIRRGELEGLLREKLTKQLRRESRGAA